MLQVGVVANRLRAYRLESPGEKTSNRDAIATQCPFTLRLDREKNALPSVATWVLHEVGR